MVYDPDAAVTFAQAQRGRPYWNQDYRRLGPTVFDCSGLVSAALRAGGVGGAPTLSWTLARWTGATIPVPEALATRGALVFMGADRGMSGYGDAGHVALCVGDGIHVVETPAWGDCGHCAGTDSGLGRAWTGGGLVPGGTPQPSGDDVDPEAKAWIGQTLIRTTYIQSQVDAIALRASYVQGRADDIFATLYDLSKQPSSLHTIAAKLDALLGRAASEAGPALDPRAAALVEGLPDPDWAALRRAALGVTDGDLEAAGGTAADFTPSSGPHDPGATS